MRLLAIWRRAWTLLSWRHWSIAAALGVALSLITPLVQFDVNLHWAPRRMFLDIPYYVVCAWLFLWAVALAEASVPGRETPSMGRYLACALGAAVACVAIAFAIAPHIRWASMQVAGGKVIRMTEPPLTNKRRIAALHRLGLQTALHGVLAVSVFVVLRNSQRAAQALADAQMERAEAAARLMSSRLQAAQAEIEPAAVLAALEDIELAYQVDPGAAEERLDALAAALRGAIPRFRASHAAAVP
ncbi:MAG TPA: hypothetical protein VFP44_21745 [Usitatibacter sp.]|nr:hypothetical protein [Usitatibacter sp.]